MSDDFALACVGVEAHDGGTAGVFFDAGIAGGADADVEPAICTKFEVVGEVQAVGKVVNEVNGAVGFVVAVEVAQNGDFALTGDVDVACVGVDGDPEWG